ncbi:MAG TPA: extensin family protein [Roseiarcus sp.]|nr:extensin family protein [Roseiarcus sp.]
MARRVLPWLLGLCGPLSLAGCGFFEHAERPAWRDQAEEACLASRAVQPSAYIEPMPEIDGPGICGLRHPFKVSAIAGGAVSVETPVTIDCSMIPALEAWLADIVEPRAEARFGQAVVGLTAFGAYSCRSIDNIGGAQLSEHAFGNAIDISGFKLADGRVISIVKEWRRTDGQESAFLHEVHAGACQHFTTVLGPGADAFHYNHFHLDLAMHGATDTGARRYCKPTPSPDLLPPAGPTDGLPPAPDIDEPQDVARLNTPDSTPLDLHGPTGALPAPAASYAAPATPSPALDPFAPRPPAPIGRPQDGDVTSSISAK